VLAVLALDHARLARRRAAHAAQLEADLARARLDALRRQLQPHFLFNTLNTIAALTETDPPRATQMVAQLGELLRHSLESHEQPLVPLAAELEFVRLYAGIEHVRFESWLAVEEDIDAGVLDAWVPPMILQPLVENAIRHGIAPAGRKCTVLLRAARTCDDRLLLEVIDDGVGLRQNGTAREGVGLRATRERLRHLFADRAQLRLEADATGTRAAIELPDLRAGTTEAAVA
jgi:two-component system, LytTR family, sensor kinase